MNPGRMKTVCVGERRYLMFERLARLPGLVHGVSTKPHDMSLRNGPDAGQRAFHRGQFARDLGLDPVRVTPALQVHGTNTAIVEQPAARVHDVDALITTQLDLPLMTFSADCPLVLLYAPDVRVLALAHTSWRCTVGVLVMLVIDRLRKDFGVDAKDLHVGIGPSAGPERYEVGAEVRAAARDIPDAAGSFQERDGRLYFDLWTANRAQLLAAGVTAERIELAGLCTITRTDWFYSHRAEQTKDRFALLAAMTAVGA